MQLATRYLVSNKTTVVLDGFVGRTEYRKLYQKNIIVAKGIDNIITFEIKNSDQKPLSILNTYTPYVEVFTEDNVLLKRYLGTIKETSTPSFKGVFTINIEDNDLKQLASSAQDILDNNKDKIEKFVSLAKVETKGLIATAEELEKTIKSLKI